MKLLVLATATAALLSVGCQSGVTFDSNLNPENFTEYAKPASVDVFTKDSILEHRYHSLGMVAGLACQESEDDYILNPENFTEYAKPASVDVFTKDSILEHRYHSLGMVAGLACQESEDDYIATEADARTDAKIKTADLGGNGVVFGKCIRLERTDACVVSVTCYGEAFKVDDSFKQQSK